MTFPYSHMSRDELISRAELEGDALAKALARALEEAEAERLEAEQDKADDVKKAEDRAEQAEDETARVNESADKLDQERDEAHIRINDALALIPTKTSHKTLIAIRDTLNAD